MVPEEPVAYVYDEPEYEEPSSLRIHSKVGGASIAGSVSVILVWLIVSLGYDVPPEVASAITGVLAFVGGYIARP